MFAVCYAHFALNLTVIKENRERESSMDQMKNGKTAKRKEIKLVKIRRHSTYLPNSIIFARSMACCGWFNDKIMIFKHLLAVWLYKCNRTYFKRPWHCEWHWKTQQQLRPHYIIVILSYCRVIYHFFCRRCRHCFCCFCGCRHRHRPNRKTHFKIPNGIL